MPEPLDLEPIKAAWKRWDADDLPAAERYEFMRFDVPALIAEVRRLRAELAEFELPTHFGGLPL